MADGVDINGLGKFVSVAQQSFEPQGTVIRRTIRVLDDFDSGMREWIELAFLKGGWT